MTFREVETALTDDGWQLKAIKGSHHHYVHPTKSGKITIPRHSGDLSQTTTKAIFQQAGLR